jgi:hypothetical protein
MESQKPEVTPLGNGEYSIATLKDTALNAFLFYSSFRGIRMIFDKHNKHVIAIKGTREDLLNYLRSLQGVTPEALQSFEEAMQE